MKAIGKGVRRGSGEITWIRAGASGRSQRVVKSVG